MRNIIIDAPFTADAAAAVALAAARRDVNIVGVAACYGRDVSRTQSEKGLRDLLEKLGVGVPVAIGAEGPIFDDYRWEGFPEDKPGRRRPEYAWDLIARKAEEYCGDVEVVAVGPLTDVGIYIKKYHDTRRNVKKVTVLGATKLFGDAASYSEFNIWADPLAMEILSDSAIPFETYGFDLFGKARFTEGELGAVSAFIREKTGMQAPGDFPQINWLDFDVPDFRPVSKTLGMAAWLTPGSCAHVRYRAKIEVVPTEMRGRVIYYDRADLSEVFNAINAEGLDKAAVMKNFTA